MMDNGEWTQERLNALVQAIAREDDKDTKARLQAIRDKVINQGEAA